MTKILPEGLVAWQWTVIFAAVYVPLSWLDNMKIVSMMYLYGNGGSLLLYALTYTVYPRRREQSEPLR